MTSKSSTRLRRALAERGQATVASACGVDVATVSRWVSEGRLDQFCCVVEALGMKILPAEMKCVKSTDELEHLIWWARKGMESVKRAEDLTFEEPE
jgi:predicted site-specific integrase-resolvase